MVLKARVSRQCRCVLIRSDFSAVPEPFKKTTLGKITRAPLIVPSGSENDERKQKRDENRAKTTKMEPSAKIQQPTARGSLTYHYRYLPIVFVCNLIVTRLNYLQGCLELKKEEQSRATNWRLVGAID
ncbi:hypothetical protein M9H77_18871 [Catharanthus roseus]|uniref:Uncharacterized protein n=1 Tax=Catharanthus roseus TaxID=4058 RepID=A0ACC0B8R5_CATRO|nr:hypothetical protein M9H77_18871 [Catharanthus roseus]